MIRSREPRRDGHQESAAPRRVRPSRRPRGAPVVQAVLEACLDELARVGYGALAIDEVARRAGVNKTTVYRRWPTKPRLVEAALVAIVDAIPPLEETGDVRSDMLAVARRLAAALASPRGRGVARVVLGGCLDPELAERAAALRRQVDAPARRLLQRAVERGHLRPGVDPDLLLATIGGWIVNTLFRERAPVTDERLAALVDLLLLGGSVPAAAAAAAR